MDDNKEPDVGDLKRLLTNAAGRLAQMTESSIFIVAIKARDVGGAVSCDSEMCGVVVADVPGGVILESVSSAILNGALGSVAGNNCPCDVCEGRADRFKRARDIIAEGMAPEGYGEARH